jgi:hypothetical protein
VNPWLNSLLVFVSFLDLPRSYLHLEVFEGKRAGVVAWIGFGKDRMGIARCFCV